MMVHLDVEIPDELVRYEKCPKCGSTMIFAPIEVFNKAVFSESPKDKSEISLSKVPRFGMYIRFFPKAIGICQSCKTVIARR
jgi:hypothetical protein